MARAIPFSPVPVKASWEIWWHNLTLDRCIYRLPNAPGNTLCLHMCHVVHWLLFCKTPAMAMIVYDYILYSLVESVLKPTVQF